MPPLDGVATPDVLKVFESHGMDITYREGNTQASSDCPFCTKEGHFFINVSTGLWDCKVCGAKGNPVTFLRQLYEAAETADVDYKELADDRGLIIPSTLAQWGCVKSPLVPDMWLIPGYGIDGNLKQLYRYVKTDSGKMRLWPTKTLAQQIFGMPLFKRDKSTVYITEGPWDGMALYEALRITKPSPDGYTLTGSEANSLISDANVIALPSCTVFNEAWAPLFDGKDVVLLFDNDYPKRHKVTNKLLSPAGWAGMKRVAGILYGADIQPRTIRYLHWGDKDADKHNASLADGYDIRDAICEPDSTLRNGQPRPTERSRVMALSKLLSHIRPIPPEFAKGRTSTSLKDGTLEMELLPCTEWKVLINAFRKYMEWFPGLDCAFSCMLAVVISTPQQGDQLWMKIVGPPGCGKTTLAEALSVNRKYVTPLSTFRGFHSGFRDAGGDDASLICDIDGKTLVTKDGDTLLKSPNLPQILSEARDLYDRAARTHYKNKVKQDHNNLAITWILCGTQSLRDIDSSELGERFLDCVVMDSIDEESEDEVLMRVAYRAERNVSARTGGSNGKIENREDPDLLRAKQLTGGYIKYLRANCDELIKNAQMSDRYLKECTRLGRFVSYMRARPPKGKKDYESIERELAARLVSQHVRLAKCLAAVLNRDSVDENVMTRVRKVALDTARGKTMDICRVLYPAGEKGMVLRQLAYIVHDTEDQLRSYMRFLRRMKIVEFHESQSRGIRASDIRWRMVQVIVPLWAEVIINPQLLRESE